MLCSHAMVLDAESSHAALDVEMDADTDEWAAIEEWVTSNGHPAIRALR